MNFTELLQDVAAYVTGYMSAHYKPELVYHNIEHTNRVVQAAKQIADHYGLGEEDYFIVVTAAWFHDLGYFTNGAKDHEAGSIALAAGYLESRSVENSVISRISGCITATRIPQSAANLLEEIVCDADLFHLGTDTLSDNDKLMRKETEAAGGKKITKEEWRGKTIALLQNHHYYTTYCRQLLDDKQQQNLDQLLQKQTQNEVAPVIGEVPPLPFKGKGKIKEKDTGRGTETMFRISSNNNQRLSDMADRKAHILITVNSIILSVIFSVLLEKLDDNPHLFYPTMLILATGVTTIVISILATRPSVTPGRFSKGEDVRKVNLLFFGNYYKMNFEDYAGEIRKIMADHDLLYSSLIRDVYAQGVVLGKKYKLLRVAYNIFMFGLILSAVAFSIAITAFH